MEPIYRAIAKAVRESKRFSLNENSALIKIYQRLVTFMICVLRYFYNTFFKKKIFKNSK